MPSKNTIQKTEKTGSVIGDHADRTSAPADSGNVQGDSASGPQKLRRLYLSLLRCRMVQERIAALRVAEEIAAPYELAIGREAISVGATAELSASDTVAASRRNLAARLARGVPIASVLGHSNVTNGCTCADFIPEDPFNSGAGIALAHKLEQKGNVVVALCHQEQPPLERWHDALRFAAVNQLPIAFVIENGIAAESSSSQQAPYLEPVSFMARDYGFPGIIVDGSDVVAVWRVAQEAIHRARIGSGPTLIDCRTDRARDPLVHMERYLRKRNLWDDAWRSRMEREIRSAIDSALQRST